MVSDRMGVLFRRSEEILQREGLLPFIKRAFLFSVVLVRSSFGYGNYYIYEKKLNEMNDFEFKPKIQNIILKIISTTDQIDEVSNEGFDFSFYSNIETFKERSNKEAILFCVFIGRYLAHASWVAMKKKSNMDPVLSLLIKDWQKKASIGPSITNPKYRGLGLYPYTLCKICEYLKGENKQSVNITTSKHNTPSIKGISKAGFEISGEMRYLKLLFLEFLKEKPTKGVT